MTLSMNDYQQLALRTAGNHGDFDRTLMYTALGLNGEAGKQPKWSKKPSSTAMNWIATK